MKKHFLILIMLLFLLSGCSQNKLGQISVDNPFEIAKGASILSYYDIEDNISIDDFTILEHTISIALGISERNDNCIIVRDGMIRYIYIVDEDIITYKGISVGDSIDKLKGTFSNIRQSGDIYDIFFNNKNEQVLTDPNKEDTGIWITYCTDGSKITSIHICDALYGRELR